MGRGEKPFDASYVPSDRYTPGKTAAPVSVTVDGEVCRGQVLGRNGPRMQVRFFRASRPYVRWFDVSDVQQVMGD